MVSHVVYSRFCRCLMMSSGENTHLNKKKNSVDATKASQQAVCKSLVALWLMIWMMLHVSVNPLVYFSDYKVNPAVIGHLFSLMTYFTSHQVVFLLWQTVNWNEHATSAHFRKYGIYCWFLHILLKINHMVQYNSIVWPHRKYNLIR